MLDLRDTSTAWGVWRQAGCCGQEEEEKEKFRGWKRKRRYIGSSSDLEGDFDSDEILVCW